MQNYKQSLHTITLDAYYIDQYPVTNTHYKACVDAEGCTPPESIDSWTRTPYYGDATYVDYLVIEVTWP